MLGPNAKLSNENAKACEADLRVIQEGFKEFAGNRKRTMNGKIPLTSCAIKGCHG